MFLYVLAMIGSNVGLILAIFHTKGNDYLFEDLTWNFVSVCLWFKLILLSKGVEKVI